MLIPKQQRGQPYPKESWIGIISQPLSQESRFLGRAGGIQVCGAGALRQDVRAATTMPANISPLQPCDRTPTGSRRGRALDPRPPRTSSCSAPATLTLAHPPAPCPPPRVPPELLLWALSDSFGIHLSPHRDTLPFQFWLPRGNGYEWEAAGPKAALPGWAQSPGYWGLLLPPVQPRRGSGRPHSRPLPVSLGLPGNALHSVGTKGSLSPMHPHQLYSAATTSSGLICLAGSSQLVSGRRKHSLASRSPGFSDDYSPSFCSSPIPVTVNMQRTAVPKGHRQGTHP